MSNRKQKRNASNGNGNNYNTMVVTTSVQKGEPLRRIVDTIPSNIASSQMSSSVVESPLAPRVREKHANIDAMYFLNVPLIDKNMIFPSMQMQMVDRIRLYDASHQTSFFEMWNELPVLTQAEQALVATDGIREVYRTHVDGITAGVLGKLLDYEAAIKKLVASYINICRFSMYGSRVAGNRYSRALRTPVLNAIGKRLCNLPCSKRVVDEMIAQSKVLQGYNDRGDPITAWPYYRTSLRGTIGTNAVAPTDFVEEFSSKTHAITNDMASELVRLTVESLDPAGIQSDKISGLRIEAIDGTPVAHDPAIENGVSVSGVPTTRGFLRKDRTNWTEYNKYIHSKCENLLTSMFDSFEYWCNYIENHHYWVVQRQSDYAAMVAEFDIPLLKEMFDYRLSHEYILQNVKAVKCGSLDDFFTKHQFRLSGKPSTVTSFEMEIAPTHVTAQTDMAHRDAIEEDELYFRRRDFTGHFQSDLKSYFDYVTRHYVGNTPRIIQQGGIDGSVDTIVVNSAYSVGAWHNGDEAHTVVPYGKLATMVGATGSLVDQIMSGDVYHDSAETYTIGLSVEDGQKALSSNAVNFDEFPLHTFVPVKPYIDDNDIFQMGMCVMVEKDSVSDYGAVTRDVWTDALLTKEMYSTNWGLQEGETPAVMAAKTETDIVMHLTNPDYLNHIGTGLVFVGAGIKTTPYLTQLDARAGIPELVFSKDSSKYQNLLPSQSIEFPANESDPTLLFRFSMNCAFDGSNQTAGGGKPVSAAWTGSLFRVTLFSPAYPSPLPSTVGLPSNASDIRPISMYERGSVIVDPALITDPSAVFANEARLSDDTAVNTPFPAGHVDTANNRYCAELWTWWMWKITVKAFENGRRVPIPLQNIVRTFGTNLLSGIATRSMVVHNYNNASEYEKYWKQDINSMLIVDPSGLINCGEFTLPTTDTSMAPVRPINARGSNNNTSGGGSKGWKDSYRSNGKRSASDAYENASTKPSRYDDITPSEPYIAKPQQQQDYYSNRSVETKSGNDTNQRKEEKLI